METILKLFEPGDLVLIGLFIAILVAYTRGNADGSDAGGDGGWNPTLKDPDGKFPFEPKSTSKWK